MLVFLFEPFPAVRTDSMVRLKHEIKPIAVANATYGADEVVCQCGVSLGRRAQYQFLLLGCAEIAFCLRVCFHWEMLSLASSRSGKVCWESLQKNETTGHHIQIDEGLLFLKHDIESKPRKYLCDSRVRTRTTGSV